MGQIVSTAAKPKRCNLNKLSQLGIPAAGEHILVSSDNSMNAAGQGNFDAYVVGDGHTVATALELKSDGFIQLNFATMHYGILNVSNGTIANTTNQQYTFSDEIPVSIGDTLIMNNPQNIAISWHRVFFYNGDTYVRYLDLGATINNWTAPSGYTYDRVRFNICKTTGTFTNPDDISILESVDSKSIKEAVVELGESVENLQEQEYADTHIETTEVTPFIYGLIGASDGAIYTNHRDYAMTDAIPVAKTTEFTIANPQGLTLNWLRVFLYNNSTFVRYINIKGSSFSDASVVYTLTHDGTFTNVRFSTGKSGDFADPVPLSASRTTIVALKDYVEDMDVLSENEVREIAQEEAESAVDGVEPAIVDLIKNDGKTIIPTWTQGQYINTSGELVVNNNAQLATTDFIAIPYGIERITMYDIGASAVSNQFSFYTSAKAYISGGTGTITTIPSNAAFIRFCSYSTTETFSTAGYKFVVFDTAEGSSTSEAFRLAEASDLEASDYFYIDEGKLYGSRASTDGYVGCVFKAGIKAIEFEISSLWDNNLITLAFGTGVDNEDKSTFAASYLATTTRTGENGSVRNANSNTPQANSIWGVGRFAGDYRQPQIAPPDMGVNYKCRIELIDGTFFRGTYYNTTANKWDFWFALDTLGEWYTPARYGWNVNKRIGFAMFYATASAKEMIKNIRILSEVGQTSQAIWNEKDCPQRNWVAIGDSITQIDKNNGLSYVGFAQRALGWACNNQGQGGWTIYKLWRDRSTAGWETAVSALGDNDVVTILAGTNDFDTASFSTPADDEAMDAATNPHPRFGTTDPTSEDAKDPHTTLGCLRLMIEDILTLKPNARLFIFSPFYREKGAPVGTTSWTKLYTNSDGKTIYDYADAIASVGREYNLPTYNTCRDCGINVTTLATYTYDDLHIDQLGGELIGEYVAKRIEP